MNMTKEEIQKLKDEHGKIFKLNVDGKNLYLKDIDRKTFKAVSTLAEKDELQAAEVMIRTLCVSGPVDEICEDWKNLLSASRALVPLISPKEASLGEV